MKKSRTIFLVVVVVIAVGAIAAAAVALSQHHKKASVNSFGACEASKGSTILMTYPVQCVDSSGRHFTQ